ncbi:MAG: T9SS type A sorting domain-containing protein, partial [Bacteroidia bacterium]|nr:T9SS type A sorting domain-containing protein [Bacteroidia bacterium]
NASNLFFRYWYHMYGNDMGELHVDILSNGVWVNDVIPAVSGNFNDQWLPGSVDLNPYSGQIINVRFRGITGNGWMSDLALDDIGVSTFTSIDDNAGLANINVYPNPATDMVHISLGNLQAKDATITILDALGRTVYTEEVNSPANTYKTEIDVNLFEAGAYIIQVENNSGIKNSKLIVN